MMNSILVAHTAQSVCQPCRIGKQRCDKSMPSCSRCISRSICCTYSKTITPLLVRRSCCLDLSDHGARELIEAARGDHEVSTRLGHSVRRICEAAQMTTAALLNEYFTTIQPWLPVIDQEAFYSRLLLWPQTNDAAFSTLLWSLFLVTRKPCLDEQHSMNNLMYRTSRQLFMLQASGQATLELLQAGLFITYYACGHGMPREAHITLMTCVAIAQLMGVDFEEMGDLSESRDERSACRWAIVLLDRIITQSSLLDPIPMALQPKLSLDLEHFMSFVDSKWPKRSFDVSSRVASLIGTALGYANDPRPVHLAGSAYSEVYDQIEKLVSELICKGKETRSGSYVFCESTSFALSAFFALQTSTPSSENFKDNSKEVLLLQSTLRMIRDNLRMSTYILQEADTNGISIIALCSLSRAAAILVRMYRSELSSQDLEMLRYNLKRFSARWAVCGNYLHYIDDTIVEF